MNFQLENEYLLKKIHCDINQKYTEFAYYLDNKEKIEKTKIIFDSENENYESAKK